MEWDGIGRKIQLPPKHFQLSSSNVFNSFSNVLSELGRNVFLPWHPFLPGTLPTLQGPIASLVLTRRPNLQVLHLQKCPNMEVLPPPKYQEIHPICPQLATPLPSPFRLPIAAAGIIEPYPSVFFPFPVEIFLFPVEISLFLFEMAGIFLNLPADFSKSYHLTQTTSQYQHHRDCQLQV